MLVAVSGFGSVWRSRVREAGGVRTRVESAYYNTTGVLVHGILRQRPKISGYVRLNGDSGFDPNYPSRAIETVFECAPPCVWNGDNKLLLRKMLRKRERPDMFLVVLQHELHGALLVGTGQWRSGDTWLISLSEYRSQQESLFLAPANAWFKTSLGFWVVEPLTRPWLCRLRFDGPNVNPKLEDRCGTYQGQ